MAFRHFLTFVGCVFLLCSVASAAVEHRNIPPGAPRSDKLIVAQTQDDAPPSKVIQRPKKLAPTDQPLQHIVVAPAVVPDQGNSTVPPVGTAGPVETVIPSNVAESVVQQNVGAANFNKVISKLNERFGIMLSHPATEIIGLGMGAPTASPFYENARPLTGPEEVVSPAGTPLFKSVITPTFKPTTEEDAKKILATHPSIGGGIDLDGVATGLGPIKQIQYHAALNALMLDDRAAYFFPVSGRNVAVLCRAIAKKDLVGVSMAVGGVRLVYGEIPKESEVAIDLTLADSFLGDIVFADDALSGYRFADGYKPQQAQASTFFPILVHFTFSDYRFEITNRQIRATNFSFSDELFPISHDKGKDGGMLPDYVAIAQGKQIPEFEANARHLASHIDHYRKERIVELASQYGEVAALLRGLGASGVDLNALAQSIEAAVGQAPRTDPTVANADDSLRIEHEWERYLKEIQLNHRYENWWAPPYDLNTKRLAQSRARAVQTFRVARVAANDVLYIRSGPDPGLSAVGSIPPNGRGVRIVGACTGQWCQVDYNSVSGWTNGYYLQPEPNQVAAIYRVIGVAADDVLNIRQGPGARFPIVGTLPPDSRGVRLASTVECVGVWCQANFQNGSGWVNTLYLGTDMADAATTFRIVNVASNDVLNIRSGPNSNLSIVGSIPPDGRGVRIVGACTGQWCPIDFHGIRGWVNKQYLADDL